MALPPFHSFSFGRVIIPSALPPSPFSLTPTNYRIRRNRRTKREGQKQHLMTTNYRIRRNHRTKREGQKQHLMTTNDGTGRNHRTKWEGQKQHPMTTNDRVRRNHRPSGNWGELPLTCLGKEAEVGMKGEALPVYHNTRAKLNKTTRATPSVRPPAYRRQVDVEIGWMLNPLRFGLPSAHQRKSPKVEVILASFWTKTKPPPTENCPVSKMAWYTATLGF